VRIRIRSVDRRSQGSNLLYHSELQKQGGDDGFTGATRNVMPLLGDGDEKRPTSGHSKLFILARFSRR
jgi:hypothetical protein